MSIFRLIYIYDKVALTVFYIVYDVQSQRRKIPPSSLGLLLFGII